MYNKNTITWILVVIIVILIIYIYSKKSEDFASTEAINNLVSMYNNGTLTATNLTTTGNISGSNIFADNINGNFIKIGKPAKSESPNWGDISWGDGSGWKVNLGKSGSPTMEIDDRDQVRVNGSLTLTKNLGANDITSKNITVSEILNTNTLNANTITSKAIFVNPPNSSWGPLTTYINAGCGGNLSKNLPIGTNKKFVFHSINGPWTAGDITVISGSLWTGIFSNTDGITALNGNFIV